MESFVIILRQIPKGGFSYSVSFILQNIIVSYYRSYYRKLSDLQYCNMKILLVVNTVLGGGTETAVLEEARLLQARGNDVLIFSADRSPEWLRQELKFYPPPYIERTIHNSSGVNPTSRLYQNIKHTIGYNQYLFNKHFKKCLSRFKPDVIHCNTFAMFNYYLVDYLRSQKNNFPIMHTSHMATTVCPTTVLIKGSETPESSFCDGICSHHGQNAEPAFTYRCLPNTMSNRIRINFFNKRLSLSEKVYSYITAPSNSLVKLLTGTKRFKGIEIVNLNYPISEKFFSRDTASIEQNQYFLFVGRVVSEKGCQQLFDVFSEVGLPLKIVGDGPLNKSLETMLKEKKLNNIELCGWKNGEELEALYKNAFCVVVPSIWFENYPLVIQEAFSYGVPVIGSINGGIPDLVQHQKTGLLFERASKEGLKKCVLELWNDRGFAQKLGYQAYKFLRENNHPDVLYPQLMKIFQETIAIHQAKRE